MNDSATAGRANISWGGGVSSDGYFIVGDEFSFSNAGLIDSMTVYEVANTPIGQMGSAPSSEFSSITLYYGSGGASGTGLNMSTSSYTPTFVTYQPDFVGYEGGSGTLYPIYALTFADLNWSVNANTVYGFAVDAVPNGENTLVLHASNAALSTSSGVTENGADNLYSLYYVPNPAGPTSTSATFLFAASIDSGVSGWDKSSDINVSINGTLVPEPSTIGFVAIGSLAILLGRRRQRG